MKPNDKLPTTGVTIRRATVEDSDAVGALFDSYRQFYEQPADLEGARRFIHARLQANDSVLLVAERDGQLVGFSQLYPSFSSLSMSRIWILNDLFVAREHRRGGVGGALMTASEDVARHSGAKGLVLSTKRTNAPAKALYEAHAWQLDVAFDHYHRFF